MDPRLYIISGQSSLDLVSRRRGGFLNDVLNDVRLDYSRKREMAHSRNDEQSRTDAAVIRRRFYSFFP